MFRCASSWSVPWQHITTGREECAVGRHIVPAIRWPAAWIERRGAAGVLAGSARVVTGEGRDVTAGFLAGARGALETCRELSIERAYLKERSPSCGVRRTHVAGVEVDGGGVTAELLQRHGIRVEGVEGRRG